MNNSIYLAPSLLAADFSQLDRQLAAVEQAGADWIHLDVMDGRFVPPITFGDVICSAVKKCTKLPLDVHLMIVEPERQIEAFANAGADYLTVHVETCPHLQRVLQEIRKAGMKPGVTLNPGTSVKLLEPILEEVDLILVMSVNPGWGGQSYLPIANTKLRQLSLWRKEFNLSYRIEVDGGVDVKTAKAAVEAGADVLVAGTAVFRGNIPHNIQALREAIQ
ncbi:MAG: ribulose-phosphate 3-epimerase [bacterium]|nr:ribulose-phosphate 3-epimerase [bacterium]